ncbi:cupin domain-containing protein [Micromonospora yasonensis]|uniref:cupin domain-containing protein n=1 Tax=Micromonospora yasonensis TaxID=1128667 RepID=UPI00222E9242|nr:cupin domain-containing protein [Micromonospora yasonensis]MCW3839546.1 cupin domain-containing protein [Micromonospora yasonensis]
MIGDRLHELRTARGLSLRTLAAEAGVSATLLSQIERGVTEPSLATLRRLATVFGESVASLFADPAPLSVWISRPGERMTLGAPNGQIRYERLTPGNGQLEVLHATLAPGEVSSEESWSHPSLECAFVVAGTLTVEVDRATYTVAAGESITLDSRQPHRYRNTSDTTTEIVLAINPPTP